MTKLVHWDFERAKNKIEKMWKIFPLIHWLLSFVYERKRIIFDRTALDIQTAQVVNDIVSNDCERAILYVVAKILAALFIYLLWKMAFGAILGKFPRYITGTFVALTCILGFVLLLNWPLSFFWQDSYKIYAYAIRLIPWYWHHFFTSATFLACIMVCPYAFSISVIQMLAYNACIVYLYWRIRESFGKKIANIVLVIIVVIPDNYTLVTQAYRNCFWTILCMYFLTYIFMEIVDRKKCAIEGLAKVILIGAFLVTWRSEGVFVALAGILIYLFGTADLTIKKLGVYLFAFVLATCIFSAPQKIGTIKYYGNDYLTSSTAEGVMNILNDPDRNIDYAGATSDLVALDKLVPLNYIMMYGFNSRRSYFYSLGHLEFDQSMAESRVQDDYVHSFCRLAIHNLKPYLKGQVNRALEFLNIDYQINLQGYGGEYQAYAWNYSYEVWTIGFHEIMDSKAVSMWMGTWLYSVPGEIVRKLTDSYVSGIEKYKINTVLRCLVLFGLLSLVLIELVRVMRGKRTGIMFGVMSFMLLIQFIVISLMAQWGYELYAFSVWYPGTLTIIIYLLQCRSAKRMLRKDNCLKNSREIL